MAAPVFLAGLAKQLATSVILDSAGGLLSGATRAVTYAGNVALPTLAPDLSTLLKLRVQNKITPEQWLEWAKFHGVGDAMWDKVIESNRPTLPIDMLTSQYWRSQVSESYVNWSIKQMGFHPERGLELFWKRPWDWSLADLRKFWDIGQINGQEMRHMAAAAGMHLEEDYLLWNRIFNPPALSESLELRNRGQLTDAELERILIMLGFDTQGIRDKVKGLRHAVPSPSDLILFATREVFDANVVQRFGYDTELPPEFVYWMGKTAMGGDPTDGGRIGVNSGLSSWAQAHWRSHWRVISPEQAYRMQQRLRADGGPNNGPRVPGVEPWLPSDTALVLKTADYPEPFRARLEAIAYNTLRLVDIRRIVRLSLEDDAFKLRAIGAGYDVRTWAKEQYKDRGQTDGDAVSLAEMALTDATRQIQAADRKRREAASRDALRAILAAYRLGVIDRVTAAQRLVPYTVDNTERTAMLAAIDAEESMKCVREGLRAIRSAYMHGRMTTEHVSARLEQAGIVPERAAQLVACWQSQRSERRVMASTAAIIGWYKAGLITEDVAYERLVNLGWDQADALLVVAKAERGVTRRGAAAASPASPARMGRARELQDLREAAIAQVHELESQIRQLTPVGLLNYLLKNGRIGEEMYLSRLVASGHTPEEAEQQLLVQKVENGQSQLQTNGTAT